MTAALEAYVCVFERLFLFLLNVGCNENAMDEAKTSKMRTKQKKCECRSPVKKLDEVVGRWKKKPNSFNRFV